MTAASPSRRGLRVNPSLLVFAAESVALPTGLVTVLFLLRMLGAEQYGVYTVSVVVIGSMQVVLDALLGRSAQTFVARTANWKPVAADIAFLHLLVGAAATASVVALAPPLSHLLRLPALAPYVSLGALDLVLYTTGEGLRSIAMATESFGLRAGMAATRWLSRLALIVIFVWSGLGVTGAILGSIGASVFELVLALVWLRLPWPRANLSRLAGFWRMAAPISLSALDLRMFERVDLLVVQALAGVVAAGLYGAAMNVTMVAGIFGMSYGAVLVTRMSRLSAEPAGMAAAARDTLRVCLRLAPPAVLGAACASDVVRLAMGPQYAAAAPLLAILAVAALAMIWLDLATALLTGAGHGRLVLLVTAPALPAAVAGHLALVPVFGPAGAAACTLGVAFAIAVAAWTAVVSRFGCTVPGLALVRNLLVCALIGVAATWGPIAQLHGVARIAALGALALLALVLSGEITKADIRLWTGGLVFARKAAA